MLLRAGFAVSVNEGARTASPLAGLKNAAAFIIRSRHNLGKSPRIRMKVQGLEGREEISRWTNTNGGWWAVRGSPYRRCDGLCVCISVRCIAIDSAISAVRVVS